jgi:hypothetical protein
MGQSKPYLRVPAELTEIQQNDFRPPRWLAVTPIAGGALD